MCGIAGIAGPGPPDPRTLASMAQTMVHRGPDGEGLWSDDTIGFAFRRLAVIDLDERSNQPLHFERWHLVFNGEIYNYRELRECLRRHGHRFRTEGDGEVLLHAWAEWGEEALDRLNGMFAFSIWDDRDKRLVLAADPFGEKPLYYRLDGARLVFGSDIKAILCDPATTAAVDQGALGAYVARAAMPETDASFFAGIRRLPAAHVLRWTAGEAEVERYWTPAPQKVPTRYGDAVATLRELLESSVRLRLRSDVSVGTSLSGGVDSSAIVGLVASVAPEARRHSFTARFPGFELDEWHHASRAARAAGVLEHHVTEPGPDELAADLERLVLDHEEPVMSSSVYAQWRVMQCAREAGVVVLLDGQGGDELFAGYRGMEGWALRAAGPRRAARRLAVNPRAAGAVAMSLALEAPRRSALGRRAAAGYRARRLVSPYAAPDVAAASVALETPYEAWQATADPLRRELFLQGFRTVLPQLLRYADRSSMAHSREVRLPLLDRRIAEFAYSLPAPFLHDGRRSKRVLRDAVADLVPASVLQRRDKIGFETPQRSWLASEPMRAAISAVLLDPSAEGRGLYDSREIERDLAGGAWRDPEAIWRAVNAEVWLRALIDAPPAAASVERRADAAVAGARGSGPSAAL